MTLKDLLKHMVDLKASDIFVIAGLPISYRISSRHTRGDGDPLTPADTKRIVDELFELAGRSPEEFAGLGNHDEDFSFALPGVGRFRANTFRQRGSYSAVIRVIPFGLPDPKELHIPEAVLGLSRLRKGLVLVCGPSGAGKTTTLACIIDRLNHERSGHIITMEDPIEYIHRHGTCIVTQREVPTDVATYQEGLQSAMREAPDVILLGEMRDHETIATAVTAAEEAQLIFSTLHTTSAAGTVSRIVDAFPAVQQRQVRIQLSIVLQAVVCQQLVPSTDGGVVPAFEIMFANTATRNLIREQKDYQIDSVIASSGEGGHAHDGSGPAAPGKGRHGRQGHSPALLGTPQVALRALLVRRASAKTQMLHAVPCEIMSHVASALVECPAVWTAAGIAWTSSPKLPGLASPSRALIAGRTEDLASVLRTAGGIRISEPLTTFASLPTAARPAAPA